MARPAPLMLVPLPNGMVRVYRQQLNGLAGLGEDWKAIGDFASHTFDQVIRLIKTPSAPVSVPTSNYVTPQTGGTFGGMSTTTLLLIGMGFMLMMSGAGRR